MTTTDRKRGVEAEGVVHLEVDQEAKIQAQAPTNIPNGCGGAIGSMEKRLTSAAAHAHPFVINPNVSTVLEMRCQCEWIPRHVTERPLHIPFRRVNPVAGSGQDVFVCCAPLKCWL